jgi:hypothetical protein
MKTSIALAIGIAAGSRAILTSRDGTRLDLVAGDEFVAPKGWTGTWELRDGYRALITFETQSLDCAMKAWFGQ